MFTKMTQYCYFPNCLRELSDVQSTTGKWDSQLTTLITVDMDVTCVIFDRNSV